MHQNPTMCRVFDLILHNASVCTTSQLRRRSPDAVAIKAGRVAAVDHYRDLLDAVTPITTVIDCGGRTIIPGIVDAHCHLFAMASLAGAVDCRPSVTATLAALTAALRAADSIQPEGWLRGYGYDDSTQGLGRHLNRRDLDAISVQRPIRVDHRSGHACVLNSTALDIVGIDRNSTDPSGGTIVRADDGQPTGLLLEMSGWISRRLASNPGSDARSHPLGTLQNVATGLLGYGITAVTDAGPDNGSNRWADLQRAVAAGAFPLRTTMMVGWPNLHDFRRDGIPYGHSDRDGRLAIGHAKIMLTASSGALHPEPATLAEMVSAAHAQGYPVAIHAIERDAVVAAALALMDARPAPDGTADRIEHCAECPPDVADLIAQSGAGAVLNTAFLHYEGERYRQTVDRELLPHLYPAGALADRGIPVTLASDAPVVGPNPWAGILAAVTRRTATGSPLGGLPVQSVSHALQMYTGRAGVAVGMPADVAVVQPDPWSSPAERLTDVRSVLTVVDGKIVWRDGL